ncbi:MAG: metal-dependent transcriptional regulator [Deltaproteobacteria bacterium]|nr:metal-dependent transcriptional regulator [Deltaproteobacteria bacterium]
MCDATTEEAQPLTGSLEDYLETIYELVRDQKVARVRDIARARGVRSASVTPAMRRLADLGLIRYVQREYIDLTDEGAAQARRVYARHQALTHLFTDVLKMPAALAQTDACAMEHSLSGEGLDYMVRFLEFLRVCPESQHFLETFHRCSLVHHNGESCALRCTVKEAHQGDIDREQLTIASLKPGQQGRVAQVLGASSARRELLNMGFLPGVLVELERVLPEKSAIYLRVQGFEIMLRLEQAKLVQVSR